MTDITYNDHASKATPTVDDFVPIWDVAAAQSKKATLASLFNARLTGGGIIATGGFTLTVPATGTAALLGTANTFTAAQTITPGAAVVPLTINTAAAPSTTTLLMQQNGINVLRILPPAVSASTIVLDQFDYGSGSGPNIFVGRNSNAGTPSAGFLNLRDLNNAARTVWSDATGLLRIHTSSPTNASDTAGTVVGAQTSALAAKDITGEVCDPGEAMAHLRDAAETALKRFKYKLGQYNGEEFEGVVVDYAPRYGMDKGRSLNLPTLFSDLIQAVIMLADRVEQLEGK